MSVPFQKQLNRFRSWPRAAQAGAVVAALLVGWWLCSDTVWSWARGYSDRAGELRNLLARSQEQTRKGLNEARDSVLAHGRVQPPRRPEEGAALLAQAATRIIKSNEGVTAYKYEARGISRLPGSALRDLVGANQRAERVTAEIQFEAAPDIVAKVLAELESSPEIDSISTLRMVRLDASKKLRVRAVIEAWVVSSGGSRSLI